jgi:LPS-assembly protein
MRWLLALLLLWPLAALSQEAASLVSDRLELGPGPSLRATGGVEVFQGTTRLTASALTYDQSSDSLTISGPIMITDAGGSILMADSATLDPDLRNGILRGARLILDRQLQLAAGRIDRVDGRYTALTRVAATSCHVCAGRPPVWEIRAAQVIHDTAEQQLYFENATLRLGGIPVFWLPRMRLPDPTLDRSAGFLIPRLRSTDLLGLGIRMPYFIPIGDSRDLTLTPYVSSATTTLEARYRQAFVNGELEVNAAVTQDDVRPDTTRGYLVAEGAFDLPRDWQLAFDFEWVSDDTYLLDYGHGDRDRLDSQLAFTRVRPDSLITADLTEYTSLRPGEDEGSLPPLIGGFSGEWRLQPAAGGLITLTAGAEAFFRETPGTGDASRDVARFGLGAAWERDWTFGPGLILTGQAAVTGDLYRVADDPAAGWLTTLHPDVQVALRWPLVRQGARAVDVLEPVLALGWGDSFGDSPPNEDSRFAEFDESNLTALTRFPGEDASEAGLSLIAGATWTRTHADGRSFALTFGRILRDQGQDIAPSGGLAGRHSDWLVAGRFDLGDGFALRARTLLTGDLDFGKTEARLTWDGARVALDAAYVWLPADPAEDRDSALSEWTLDAAYQINDRWRISADGRYDVAADRPAQAGLGLQWQNECVTVDLSVSRRYTTEGVDDPRTDFGLSVALSGFSTGSGARPAPAACRQ